VNNLLKEDVISASANLDAAALIKNRAEVLSCVEDARRMAGLNVEVIQNCAFRYLLLLSDTKDLSGALTEAERDACVKGAVWCLRYLVSEDYNGELNGRALSRLYKQLNDVEGYTKLRSCLKAKHSFVYQWMEPWQKGDLQKEWLLYCQGAGMQRAVAKYVDCRSRLIMRDFLVALSADIELGAKERREALKKENWGQEVELDDVYSDLKFRNNDPKAAIHEMLWFRNNGSALRKSIFNGAFTLNLIGGTANGIAAGSLAVAGISAVGLGMLGVLPGVVGATYALYKNRMSNYGVINPDSQTNVPRLLGNCYAKLRDHAYDDVVMAVLKSEQAYLNAVAAVVNDPDGGVDFEHLEILLREFVMRQAAAFCRVMERVLPIDTGAVEYWMGTTTAAAIPECVRFSTSLECQTELMRMLAIDLQIVRDHFIIPRYFENIFPQGETLSYLSPSILFED